MSQQAIQQVERADARVRTALAAESRLFAHYGLKPRTHYVEVDDPAIRVRALEVGAGPPVLLVPGGNGEAFPFVPLMAQLQGWRLITFDRPGAGMSDTIDHRQVNVRRLAVDTLTAVLDTFDLESVPVVASSMGGLWALWLAMDRPERVSKMVQIGCPALILGTSAPLPMRLLSVSALNRVIFPVTQPGSPQKARGILQMIGCSSDSIRALPDVFPETMYRMFNLPGYRTAWISLMESALTLRGSQESWRLDAADLARVEHETLFVWGDNDRFGSVEVGLQAVRAMPNASLEVVASGHAPFIDSPQECGHHIRQFLSASSAGTIEGLHDVAASAR